jgi:hypothetical protein
MTCELAPCSRITIGLTFTQLVNKLCKILGFHDGDYEECFLGYKNPVRTSQETHYVSATEPSRLLLCKV